MKNSKLHTALKEIGLTDKESAIYLASLSLGPSTILKLSKESGVKRTTAYSVIESLKERGLINIEITTFKTVYRPESPKKLEYILEVQREKLKRFSADFMSLYNLKASGAAITFYDGLESIKSVYSELLTELKRGDKYLVITNQKDWYEQDKKFFQNFIEKRANLKLEIKILMQDSDIAKRHKEFEMNYGQKVKIFPKNTKLEMNMVITPKKLIIHQLTSPISAIVITNNSIIKSHRELFMLIWNFL